MHNGLARKRDVSSSSDDDSVVEDSEIDGGGIKARIKRGMAWCGINTEASPGPFLSWPPDPSQVGNASWRNLRQSGGPNYGNRMQLYSKTNFNLAVHYDKIYGTQDDDDLHTHLELINAGRPGSVRICGSLTQLYVAMDNRGRLYPTAMQSDDTVFEEAAHGLYNTYLSLKNAHKGWYLGIKKSGTFKNGKKTAHKQKACLFLPRRKKFALN